MEIYSIKNAFFAKILKLIKKGNAYKITLNIVKNVQVILFRLKESVYVLENYNFTKGNVIQNVDQIVFL